MESKVQETVPGKEENEHRIDLVSNLKIELKSANKLRQIFHCSIYKVPQKIREINEEAYTPRVVSIGPLHHGKEWLKPMEEVKLEYLKVFLERTHAKLEDIIEKLRKEENRIRSCYAVTIPQHGDEFLRIILIDACFIIEHFLRWSEYESWKIVDPIISKPWWINDVARDLILLENQLPFFVLKDIFNLAFRNSKETSFLELSFHYFKMENGEFTTKIEMDSDVLPFAYFCDHLLKKTGPKGESVDIIVQNFTDLRRIFYLPHPGLQSRKSNLLMNHLYSASQLEEAGVIFKASPSRSIIQLQFEKGVLAIPPIVVSDETETFLRNIVALEQCRYPYDSYVTDYVRLLDFLLNDSKDVDILVDKEIMVNGLGDSNKVATMVNKICLGLTMSNASDEYVKLCEKLNAFYDKPIHKDKAIFIRDYWSTPWKKISFAAGIVLLVLTLIQTICTIIPLV